jgi:ABC-type taurine transport system substrate-binding protein
MNERIEKLARQAEAAYIPRYDMWQMDSETVEKFAMLVIQDYENDVRESRREVKSELGYSRIGRNNV